MCRAARREAALAMLARVRIKDPAACLSAYPHEFSGGMRQRIMLASARPYLDTAAWLAFTPGVCIAATLLGANLLSDAIRDGFDPRRAA